MKIMRVRVAARRGSAESAERRRHGVEGTEAPAWTNATQNVREEWSYRLGTQCVGSPAMVELALEQSLTVFLFSLLFAIADLCCCPENLKLLPRRERILKAELLTNLRQKTTHGSHAPRHPS